MDEMLKKLSQLPLSLRQALSAPQVLDVLESLESQYRVKMTLPLIQIVVGEATLDQYLSALAHTEHVSQSGLTDIKNKFATIIASLPAQKPAVPDSIKDSTTEKKMPQSSTEQSVSPASVFSTDDDAEIDQYKNGAVVTPISDYDRLADALIAEFGYTTSEEVLRKRLKNNILARLRGVRDNLEAREVLEKSKKIGGLEFTPEQSSALLQLIARKMPQVTVPTTADTPHITFPTQRPFALPSRISLEDKKKMTPNPVPSAAAMAPSPASTPSSITPPPIPVETKTKETTVSAVAKPATAPVTASAVQPVIEEEDGLPVIRYASPKPAVSETAPSGAYDTDPQRPATEVSVRTETAIVPEKSPQPVIAPVETQDIPARPEMPLPQPQPYTPTTPPVKQSAAASRKPSLDGVKLVKQSVGPIDELSGMTLIDFRRLSTDPEVAVDKIFAKIELLTADGYSKRLEGIAAWRMSEVSKFYRLLGQASLNNHQSVEEVIADRLKAEKPTLSLTEFEAVMALNEKLRY
jgi:hypothetical protein